MLIKTSLIMTLLITLMNATLHICFSFIFICIVTYELDLPYLMSLYEMSPILSVISIAIISKVIISKVIISEVIISKVIISKVIIC
jgi:hypothetical protein